MKKLIIAIACLIVTIVGRAQSDPIVIGDTMYFPSVSSTGQQIRQMSFFIVKPSNYDPKKSYPLKQIIHGMGERSEGKIDGLRNLAQGSVYYVGGPRQWPFIPDDCYANIKDSQFIIVVPNYTPTKGMSTADVNFVFDQAERYCNIDKSRESLFGFSLGGGIVSAYISTSSADRLQYAVLASPVNNLTSASCIKSTRLPVITISATVDNQVSSSTSDAIANSINASGTDIKAYRIKMPGTGHGGLNEMLYKYIAGVPQSIYAYENKVTKDSPLQYPSTGSSLPPVVIPEPIEPVIVRDGVPAISTTGKVTLNACATKNSTYTNWTVISVPKGASLWTPYIAGAGNCAALATFTIEGAYGITVTATNGSAKVVDTFYVTYQKQSVPIPRVATSYDKRTDKLIFQDGSSEDAIEVSIDFVNKKAVVKTESGIYSIP